MSLAEAMQDAAAGLEVLDEANGRCNLATAFNRTRLEAHLSMKSTHHTIVTNGDKTLRY